MTQRKNTTKKQQRRLAAEQELANKVKRSMPDREMTIVQLPDGIKMSEVLEQFVQPWRNEIETAGGYRQLLFMAVIAWNLTFIAKEERDDGITGFRLSFPEDMRKEAEKRLYELIERKEKHFSQYRIMIRDFKVLDEGKEWYLTVISTPLYQIDLHKG